VESGRIGPKACRAMAPAFFPRRRSAPRLRLRVAMGLRCERRAGNPRIDPTSAGRRMPVLRPLTTLHPAAMPESLWWGRHGAHRVASRGQVLLLVDGGRTRERCLPRVPDKGMSGQAQVYRPLAGGNMACTSPRPHRQGGLAVSSTSGNSSPPCPFGEMPSIDGPGSSPGKVVFETGTANADTTAVSQPITRVRARAHANHPCESARSNTSSSCRRRFAATSSRDVAASSTEHFP
jgi:hypothetical protein